MSELESLLPSDSFQHLQKSIQKGTYINNGHADVIAFAIKNWALDNGASNYCYWFHSANCYVAEKHDAFLEYESPLGDIEAFSGDSIGGFSVKAFESDGMGRNSFESRGNIAWLPSSPPFILGNTLSIPSVFVSYSGSSIDFKTAFSDSVKHLNEAAIPLFSYIKRDVQQINVEFEWNVSGVLMDEKTYFSRPDLFLSEKVLIENLSENEITQSAMLEDNSAGVAEFFEEVEAELEKIGKAVCISYNGKRAPYRFRIISEYHDNLMSIDKAWIIIEVLKRMSRRHGFKVIFKHDLRDNFPVYARVNSYALNIDRKYRLLQEGESLKANQMFLLTTAVFYLVIKKFRSVINVFQTGRYHEGKINKLVSLGVNSEVHKLFGRILDAIGGAMDEKGMLNLKNEIAQLQRSGISFEDDKNGYTLEFATQKILLNEFDLLSHDLNPIIFINLMLAREFRNVTEGLERHTRKGCKKDEAFFLVLYDLICKTRDVWDGIPKFQINNELLPGQHLPAAYAHYFKTINSPIVVDLLTHYTKDGSDRLRIIFFHKAQLYKKQIQAEIHLFRIIFSNYIEPATLEYENTFIGNLSKLQEIYGSDFLDEAMHKKTEIMEVAALLNALKNSVMQLSEYVELKCRQTDTDDLFEEFLCVDKIYRSIYKNVNQLQKTIYSGKWFS